MLRILPESILSIHEDIKTKYEREYTEKSFECSICYESHYAILLTRDCSQPHKFCTKCLRNWMKINRECPVCRTYTKNCTYKYILKNT